MICTFLRGRMKKAIWFLAFSLLVMPLLIQFFEVDCFRASASEDAVLIEFGETLSGSIGAAAEMDTYVFSGNASDLILVRVNGPYPGIRLYSPNGTKLKGASGGLTVELSYTLPDDGEYNILVYASLSMTGSYTLSLKSITIWSSDSMGNEKNTFASTETVYATVPATGENVTFYIVAGQDVWNDGDPLTDVSDGAQQLTLDPGPGIQVVQVWGPPLTLGSYDIVIDTNDNGLYDAGVDWIDSMAEVGFVVEYTPVNSPPYQPQLSITPSLAVEDNDDLIVTVIGPTPADPDGDTVTYTYRWLVDVGTGEFLDDEVAGRGDHTGNVVPAADTVVGDIWRVEVTPVDEHEAVGPNAIATWQPVVPDATKPVADAGPDQTVTKTHW